MSKGGGGGGQQTVNTQVQPPSYALPFLEFGLSEAKDQYTSGKPNYYPGSTVVGFSPETEMALTGIRNEATDPNSMTAQAQNIVQQNLMGTNPLLSAAFKPAIDQVTSQFAKSGRYGSGANQAALTSALAPIAYKAQQDALAQAPQAALMDEKLLTGVGEAREGLAQAELQDNINRFNFEQNQPMQNLKDYMALVSGGTIGSNTIEPVSRNTASSALGGALGGAQLAQGVGFDPMLGAIGGGLLGLL
tara:strand:+ start:109 stop:849 length:741 start_codon:yes stop_codon:yes gene_type:complete